MDLLNRIALIVTPKRRCLAWVNALPEAGPPLGAEQVASLRTIHLVLVNDELELEEVIDTYWEEIFAEFLEGWMRDEDYWPRNRTPHMFRDWFSVEMIDLVLDADPDHPLTMREQVLTRCTACDAPLGDGRVVVALEPGRTRRLSDAEASEVDQLADEPENDQPEDRVLAVFRCCGTACAVQIEKGLAEMLEKSREPES